METFKKITMSNVEFNFYILGGFLQSKKQALRTSPTNRGSSVVKTSFLLPKFCKQNLLRLRFGTACGRCSNPCHGIIEIKPANQVFSLQNLQDTSTLLQHTKYHQRMLFLLA